MLTLDHSLDSQLRAGVAIWRRRELATRRERYAARFSKDAIMVVLDPDVAEVFPDHNSVNKALRALGHIIHERAPKVGRRRSAG